METQDVVVYPPPRYEIVGLLQQCSYAPVNELRTEFDADSRSRNSLFGGRSRRFANHCWARAPFPGRNRLRGPPVVDLTTVPLWPPAPPSASPSTPAPPGSGPWSSTSAARVVDLAYRELTQYFPRPGWVEHDADEIWRLVRETLAEVAGRLGEHDRVARSIGITNQRETVVAWDRTTGRPLHRALVWQDRRTADRCAELHGGRPPPPGAGADRAGARPLLLGHQDAVAARGGRRPGRARPGPRHRRLLDPVEPDRWRPTAASSPPTSPTPRGPCSSTSSTGGGPTELCDLFRVPAVRPARGAALVRSVRHGGRRRPGSATRPWPGCRSAP